MSFNKNLSAAALALLIVSGSAVAQVKKKPVATHLVATHTATAAAAPSNEAILPVDQNVRIGKLAAATGFCTAEIF